MLVGDKIKIRHCGEKRHGVSFFAVFCVRKIGKKTKKKYAVFFESIGCKTGQAWKGNMSGKETCYDFERKDLVFKTKNRAVSSKRTVSR